MIRPAALTEDQPLRNLDEGRQKMLIDLSPIPKPTTKARAATQVITDVLLEGAVLNRGKNRLIRAALRHSRHNTEAPSPSLSNGVKQVT